MKSILDRSIEYLAPAWALRRARARVAGQLLARHYEAAATGRRTSGWARSSGDVNSVTAPALQRIRDQARDLVRNNPHAASAVDTIADQVVGWGITAKPRRPIGRKGVDAWDAWANSTDCDADGRHDLAGLQALATRTIVESGEVLIRRRLRRVEDGLALPIQVQVLEPDYLDTTKTGIAGNTPGSRIVNGVEFDVLGRRVAYWMFPDHPGGAYSRKASRRVPADGVRHVYRVRRPGQVRGVSWFAPVTLKLRDWDEFDDATLMKQKVAALLAVVVGDPDGMNAPLGTADADADPITDTLEPGAIIQAPAGRTVSVVQPPATNDFGAYAEVTLRAIATGIGVAYEDLTGDYTDLPFSAARMSRLRQWARVESWRWRMLVPGMLDPVWSWAMEAAAILGLVADPLVRAEWTAPPLPFVDPDKEGLAYTRNVRAGLMSLSEALRERGFDPDAVLEEIAADNATLDSLGLFLDSDPRRMTQGGQAQTFKSDAAADDGGQAADTGQGDGEGDAQAEGDAGGDE